ncbi:MAG TPA: hypothetical protein VLB04_12040 [Methanotrichaceae archaeon]|nr:hypothetical protein [Methanotrichaceae archaeon]
MDYVVHINDGSREIRPIVLRLLPGEETIFNLKVVNHGEPSNISLEASDPLIKAVRLKRPDHYVVMEENIPVMARMPERVPRLEGELLLTSSAGESIVQISLVSESEGFGDDQDPEDMQRLADEDLSDDIDDREGGNRKGEDRDGVDEDRELDEDDGEGDGAREDEASEVDGSHEEAERIRFSRQKDLQSYRAASRSRSTVDFGNSQEHREEHQGESNYGNYGNETGYERGSEQRNEGRYIQSYGQSHDQGSVQGYEQVPHISPEDEGSEENLKEGLRDRILTMSLNRESIQIVPTIILLSLIVALVLTFYTESIPVYPGALASSILIVTLIIYGAATLLKA